jgi:signal peptidase I
VTETAGEAPKKNKKQLPLWLETIVLLVTALVLAIIIKTFFLQAFYIPSESMEPEFIKNDRILVQKTSYWFGEPQRGDIVVFQDPGGWLSGQEAGPSGPVVRFLEVIGLYPSGGHLVKRVIGVGGDRVICCDDQGRISVNGKALDESYLKKGSDNTTIPFDVRVPEGHLWMMGDNRNNSWDSRGHMGQPGGGFVAEDKVVGKAFALIWPFDRATFIHRPSTFKGIPSGD